MQRALPAIAVVILAFAAVSRRLEGTSITAPMVFTGAGLILGRRRVRLLHGLTAAALARRYASWYSARPVSGIQAESAHEIRWRTHLASSGPPQAGARS